MTWKKGLTVASSIVALIAVASYVWLSFLRLPSVSVSDVKQRETLVLGKEAGKPIFGMMIRGSGHIEGEAEIALILGGHPYRVVNLSGTVEFEWGGDWYSETAEVRYEPKNVRSGQLTLRYQFHRLH